jgi:CubicO group peptidase (beta-lactamase class C family)
MIIHKENGKMWRFVLLIGMLLVGMGWGSGPRPLAAQAVAAQVRATQAGAEPLRAEAVEAFFDAAIARQLDEEHLVGATVAVVQGDALLFTKGYGYADLAAQRRVVADRTLFYIGSVGKLFTWTAIMQLAEQGKVDLHADVNTYLDFELPDVVLGSESVMDAVTLHHLMTHTAGFEEQFESTFVAEERDLLPLRELLVRTMPERVYPPGTVFAYSNYGTALAGYILELVSGKSYEQYITTHLLEPLGMAHSSAMQPLPHALAQEMSLGYHTRGGTYDALDFEWVAGAPCAAVRATAPDVARFMRAHLNGGCVEGSCILQAATLAEMHRRQFTHDPALAGMAYGFVEANFNGQRVLWHMGESARFVTVLALLPETNVGLLISYNTPPADGRTLMFQFLDTFYPVERAPLVATSAPGWTERAAVVRGSYVSTRSAHTTEQKVLAWLEAIPVQVTAAGELALGPQRYVETEPWLFQQRDGDRALTFRQDAGRTWLFWGPFAYFKLHWYESPLLHLGLWAASLLLFTSGWIAWPLAAWRARRRGMPTPQPLARGLAAGLGLLVIGLLAWFVTLMLGFGTTYAYPAAAAALITRLLWLAVPLTLAVLVLAIRSWFRRDVSWVWRLHYNLITLASAALLWSLHFWNLLAF